MTPSMRWSRIGKLGRVEEHGQVLPDEDDARVGTRSMHLCADVEGWNLRAAVTVRAGDDVGLENLCRCVLVSRPAWLGATDA